MRPANLTESLINIDKYLLSYFGSIKNQQHFNKAILHLYLWAFREFDRLWTQSRPTNIMNFNQFLSDVYTDHFEKRIKDCLDEFFSSDWSELIIDKLSQKSNKLSDLSVNGRLPSIWLVASLWLCSSLCEKCPAAVSKCRRIISDESRNTWKDRPLSSKAAIKYSLKPSEQIQLGSLNTVWLRKS